MKIIIKAVFPAIIACSTIILVSCASVDTLNEEAALWKGRSVSELVTRLGPAHNAEDLSDGTTIRQWVSEGGRKTVRSNFFQGLTTSNTSGTRTCIFNAVSKNDKISRLFYRVQNDSLVGHARRVCGYFRKALEE